MPKIFLRSPSCICVRVQMAPADMTMKVMSMGRSRFQVTYLLIRKLMMADVVRARRPDNVVASPYEGIRKGRSVIMNMPNPNPVVRWMKLAPTVRIKILTILSISSILTCKDKI